MTAFNMKTALATIPRLPPEHSVLLRGKHGVGKSQLVRQLMPLIEAKTGVKFNSLIDRRLSQLCEGDIIGLPICDGETTKFAPSDWFLEACKYPCILFLDELNRALPGVIQAVFQIALDRELNGHKLHPDTRVFVAVNRGPEYIVSEMDPALIRRFWCIDLEPSAEDWLEWAPGAGIVPIMIDFLAAHRGMLDPDPKADLTDVHTTRHSWHRLSDSQKYSDVFDPEDPMFLHLACGYVGTEAARAYLAYVRENDTHVDGEEICTNYPKVRKKVLKMGAERWGTAIASVGEYFVKMKGEITDENLRNLIMLADDLPGDNQLFLWKTVNTVEFPKPKDGESGPTAEELSKRKMDLTVKFWRGFKDIGGMKERILKSYQLDKQKKAQEEAAKKAAELSGIAPIPADDNDEEKDEQVDSAEEEKPKKGKKKSKAA